MTRRPPSRAGAFARPLRADGAVRVTAPPAAGGGRIMRATPCFSAHFTTTGTMAP
ncbi:hypothetical protein AB0L71_00840 [Streptomyces sp. NPDC052052]|uniref:hypothetical protein n=1 Tax=Streptomyces sp. NPDC052052 TaxID=3154756 RepID=UPI0034374526